MTPSVPLLRLAVAVALAALVLGCAVFVPRHVHLLASRPSATPTARAFRPTRVTTIGDSIMAGKGLDAAQAWPALIDDDPGVSVRNLGCSGAGFIAVGSCGTDFAGLVPQAVSSAPQLVLLESSDNDLGEPAAPLAAATTQTVAAIHKALPHAEIIGMNTLWDQPGAVPAEVGASSADLQRALAAVHGTYVDIGQPLAGQASLLQSDSEHPTVAGQVVLARTVRAALRRVHVDV